MNHFIKILILAIFCQLTGCRNKAHDDGRAKIVTESDLGYIQALIEDPLTHEYFDDPAKLPLKTTSVRDALNESNISSEKLKDGWKNDFLCILIGDKFHIWSIGKNKKNEERRGDDIFITIKTNQNHQESRSNENPKP